MLRTRRSAIASQDTLAAMGDILACLLGLIVVTVAMRTMATQPPAKNSPTVTDQQRQEIAAQVAAAHDHWNNVQALSRVAATLPATIRPIPGDAELQSRLRPQASLRRVIVFYDSRLADSPLRHAALDRLQELLLGCRQLTHLDIVTTQQKLEIAAAENELLTGRQIVEACDILRAMEAGPPGFPNRFREIVKTVPTTDAAVTAVMLVVKDGQTVPLSQTFNGRLMGWIYGCADDRSFRDWAVRTSLSSKGWMVFRSNLEERS